MNNSQAATDNRVLLAGRWLVLLVLAELLSALLIVPQSSPSDRQLAVATIVLVLGIQLLPRPSTGESAGVFLPAFWSALCACAALLGLTILGPSPIEQALQVAGGVFVLALFFCSLSTALGHLLGDRRAASRLCVALLLLGLSLPLWAAPLALSLGSGYLVDTIIALCPLSYLATLIDIDYLRSDWWYRYLPYGGMRYNYADPLPVTLAMLGSASLLALLARRPWPRPGADASSIPPIVQEINA